MNTLDRYRSVIRDSRASRYQLKADCATYARPLGGSYRNRQNNIMALVTECVGEPDVDWKARICAEARVRLHYLRELRLDHGCGHVLP